MIKIFIFCFFFICISFNSFASVKNNIISNLKDIKNISFDFEQTINDKSEKGVCIIQYPKKIFCEYNNIKKKILVSNGESLVIKNRTNNQFYIYPLDKTPLFFILDKDSIIKKIKETKINIVQDKFYLVSFEDNKNNINIFFDKDSLNLLGWQTEDLYQNLAITYIFNLKKNKQIDEKKFIIPTIN
tara:strand:- start:279 stop:836 length:558 start_codon:yes stop_codon:yes gene_type:complete